jgi:hypothetical protein
MSIAKRRESIAKHHEREMERVLVEPIQQRNRLSTQQNKSRQAAMESVAAIDYNFEIDPAKLIDLAYDTLSVVTHRVTSEQLALNQVLGDLGAEFDSTMFALTNKLLYQDPFVEADEFMELLYDLVVVKAKVCTPRYFKQWLKEKPHEKGKTGKQRMRHNFSAKRNLMLRNRRLYILYPSPRILFGCLQSFNSMGHHGYRALGKSADDGAPNSSDVFLEVAPFGPPVPEIYRSLTCSPLINSAYGCFFGVSRICEEPGHSAIFSSARQVRCEDTSTGFSHWNPWEEILDCTRNFLRLVIWFFNVVVKIVPQLGDEPQDDGAPEPASIRALRWPHLAMFRDENDPTVQAMSVFEIVSSVETYMYIVNDVIETDFSGDDGDEGGISWDQRNKLSAHTEDMRKTLDRYVATIYSSDLHFFFAYFRGSYIQYSTVR